MLPELDTFYERLCYAKDSIGPKVRWRTIADAIGIDKANFSRYKNGKYFPSPVTLLKIARELGVDARWLAGKDIVFPEDGMELLAVMYEALNYDGKAEILAVLKNHFGHNGDMEGIYERISVL